MTDCTTECTKAYFVASEEGDWSIFRDWFPQWSGLLLLCSPVRELSPFCRWTGWRAGGGKTLVPGGASLREVTQHTFESAVNQIHEQNLPALTGKKLNTLCCSPSSHSSFQNRCCGPSSHCASTCVQHGFLKCYKLLLYSIRCVCSMQNVLCFESTVPFHSCTADINSVAQHQQWRWHSVDELLTLSALSWLGRLWAGLSSTAIKITTVKHLSEDKESGKAGLQCWVESWVLSMEPGSWWLFSSGWTARNAVHLLRSDVHINGKRNFSGMRKRES